MTNEQAARLLREMADRRGEYDFALDSGEFEALLYAAEQMERRAAEPSPFKHTIVRAAGVEWKVYEDPKMHPDCFIVNGRAFRLTDSGLIELS